MACPFASKEKQQKGIYKNTTKRALAKNKGSNVFSEKNRNGQWPSYLREKTSQPKNENVT